MSDVDTTTPIVGLIKPAFDGRADIREINTDMDLIDARFGTLVGAVINPMTGVGDLIRGGTGGAPTRVPAGTEGQRLTVVGGVPVFQTPPPDVGFNNPMTTPADLIVGGAGGTATRLAIGAATQVLTVVGGVPTWQAPVSGGMTNPMTGTGDLIVGGASGAANRLGVGTGGQVLTVVGGTAAWQSLPPDVGFANPMTASGDIIRGGASGAATRVAPGSANQVLTIQAGVPAWLTGAGQVLIGPVGPASQAGLSLGSTGDVNLYRTAADTLATDDGLLVAGAGGLAVSVGGATFSGGGVVVSSAGGLSVTGAAGAAVTTGPLALGSGTLATVGAMRVANGFDLWGRGVSGVGDMQILSALSGQITLGGTSVSTLVSIQSGAGALVMVDTAVKVLGTGAGLVVGTPTGGNKGAGTINAVAVYDDNVLLTDALWDLYYDGALRPEDADDPRWADARVLGVEETAAFTRANRHLPTMPGRAEWTATGPKSLGALVSGLWATVEQLQMHLYDAHARIAVLEAR